MYLYIYIHTRGETTELNGPNWEEIMDWSFRRRRFRLGRQPRKARSSTKSEVLGFRGLRV